MGNTKSYGNQQKFISHRNQSIDLHRKSMHWFYVSRVFAGRFLEQTITFSIPVVEKNFKIYL